MEEEIRNREVAKLLKKSEDVVVSGVGGRFPSSANMDEFADNLYKNVDMITEDENNERWPKTLYGMNNRMGRIKDADKFDGAYFGLLSRAADLMEPQARILLETTFEAICDAGIPPQSLRGSRTGVYIGMNSVGMPDHYPQELQLDSKNSFMNTSMWVASTGKNMYANRLSFAFDFRGPSLVIDTACSSSLAAVDVAVTDIRLGKCDQAIVGTGQVDLQPFTNFIFQNCHFNAPDGISKVWDKDADGFVRAETVACVFLQKKSQAKRIYATLVHTKTNIDGFKTSGNFFPSKEGQQRLLEETLIEAGIDPNEINYFEAHGTGTKVGDPQEAKAIAGAYCKNRKDELMVGLLKSNIGHGEGTSGIATLCKALISFENKCIAANLNLKVLKPEIAEYCPPLKPVNENTAFEPKIAGINSFGLGGVNAHAILKANLKENSSASWKIIENLPRLVNVCGRTQESLDYIFNFIENNPEKITRDFLALLNDMVKTRPQLNSAGFPYRGSMIIKNKEVENGKQTYQYSKESSLLVGMKKPIWFFFSGMGSQWIAMAKSLMAIDVFAKSIHKCADVLKQYRVDLLYILLAEDPNALNSIVNPFVAITSVQIALYDMLEMLDVKPDGIIGHSFGEIACAYADGCLTLEQAILCSYWRGKVVEDSNIPSGKMAAVGMSWEDAKKRCPKNVFVACDNAHDSVTISGVEAETTKFIEKLKSENVFVRDIAGYNLKPYHSPYLNPLVDVLTKILSKVIPEPKPRSEKWYSTSVHESKWDEDLAKFASAEYFVNNLIKPVLFTSTLRHAPADAIVIEIAPHALFANLIKRTLETANYIGLMKRNNNVENLEIFLNSLGKLYQLGMNVSIEKLYPKVEWPVARGTQSLSSLIKWDHKDIYLVKRWPEYWFQATASDMNFKFSLDNPEDVFLQDHCIEGRVIFPATGYLMLAWRRLAASRAQQWNDFSVVFENVQFRRPVMFENGEVKLTIRYLEPTGEFVVLDGGNVACFGKIAVADDENGLQLQHLNKDKSQLEHEEANEYTLDTNEFYRELRIRGYDYGPKFQGVVESKFIDLNKVEGKVKWTNNTNPIVFFDSILQLLSSVIPIRSLFIPVGIESLKCDPKMLFKSIEEFKQFDTDAAENEMEDTIYAYSDATNIAEETYRSEISEYKKDLESTFKEFQEQTGGGRQKWTAHLPVVINLNLRTIVSHGLEIRGFVPVNIPRRPQNTGLRLEKYRFVSYTEENAIENDCREDLINYIKACCYACMKLVKDTVFEKHEELIRNFRNMEFDTKSYDELTKDIRDDHVLLKVLHGLLQATVDVNKNAIEDTQLITKLKEDLEKPEFDLSKDVINLVGRNERLIRPILDVVNKNSTPIKVLKVLEVNPSNGLVGSDVIHFQTETFIAPVAIDYSVANKNPEKLTNDEGINTSDLKLLNWNPEECAFPQGLSGLDLVIYRDVFDFELNLDDILNGALGAIKSNGFLLAIFRKRITVPELLLSTLKENGKLPTENELAKKIDNFETKAVNAGFNIISKKSDSLLYDVILFRKVNKNVDASKQAIITMKHNDYDNWLPIVKEKIFEFKGKPADENIWIVANDSPLNGIIGLIQCLRVESGGDKLRCIFDPEQKLPKLDFKKSPFKEILENDLVQNIFKDDCFGCLNHLSLSKNDDQIETDRAYINVLQRGDLSSMQWFDGRNLNAPFWVNEELKDQVKQLDCDVYYAALNFRDVMMATGRIAPGPEGAVIDCLIGSEFSGRRHDTGERIFGMSLSFGIASSVSTSSPLIFKVPDEWSLEDAATVSTVYMTVWYGLIERAKLSEGESVLIHSGSGGVGQAAISVCQHLNCKVFTTVGTDEKREFLKKTYGLTDEQIFNSRTTDFEFQVLSATDGKGVNVVLNSLSEEKLLASFRCVGDNGRFVEIGKYDFQMNNPLPMFAFLRNISFHGIMLDKMSLLDTKYSAHLFEKFATWLYDGIKKRFVRPLIRTIFKPEEAKSAFKYMMTGKHIGKVLIKIRDEEKQKAIVAKPVKMIATTKTWFDPEKVYIIVGGLGGMGIEMVYWMMLRGAKKLILTSRSGIKSNAQRLFFKQLEELGKMQEALKINISISNETAVTLESAKKLIEYAETQGKVGGIFQLAVVLHDALLENQSVDTYKIVCESKINITENLDKITRQYLSYPLEYFVAFSSIACGRGNTGQSPYGYGCSVMERICEDRRKNGHHGVAIQWGPIGDVGVLVETMDEEKLKMAGLILQRLPSWLQVLDKFLHGPHAVLASSIRAERQAKVGSSEENLMKQLWSALGVDPKTVPNHVTLGELGMESFVAVELQQRLERDYDINLSLNEIKRITIGELKEFQSGNKEKLKTYATDIKLAKANLSKIKFEIPTETVTKLNDVKDGTPVYFLPPIEGIFSNLLPLIQLLNFPVYGLNWTRDMEELKSMKEITNYYTKLLKTLAPKGDYILLTFSFGSAIALKMCYKKAPVKKLFIIDSFSSSKLQTDVEAFESEQDQTFDQLFRFVNRNVPETFRSRIKNDVLMAKGEEERINKLIQSIKDFGDRGLVGKDLEPIIRGSLKKGKLLNECRKKMIKKLKAMKSSDIKNKIAQEKLAKKKIKSEVIIIKSTDNPDDPQQLEDELLETYGLSKETIEGKYHMEVVVGAPEEVLTANVEKTAQIIKSNF